MSDYVVFLDNGTVVTVAADHMEYDSDYLEFFDEENTRVAMFITDKIFGYFKKTFAAIGGESDE